MAVPGGAGGFILGSILIKKLSLTPAEQLRAMFYLAILSLLTMLMFAIQCETAPLADLSKPCSSGCSCGREWFEPVCAAEGLTYFSPCYAGCQNLLGDSVSYLFIDI